jgi:RNAse (barnase) inhibitor barstar
MPPKKQQSENNFFALLKDGAVRKITLNQKISAEIKKIFIDATVDFKSLNVEEIEFDGNYRVDPDEILFINFTLPDAINKAIINPISIQILNLEKDEIQALYWVEQKKDKTPIIYFQNFDTRKVLKNKHILTYSTNTYPKLDASAFIVDETISAIFEDKKLFFKSYVNANKIFSLADYYQAATDADIDTFSKDTSIEIDVNWFKENSNSTIRKQITLIQKSKILKGADVSKIKKGAANFELEIKVSKGKLCFPNDIKICKDILAYLNENLYVGPITGTKLRTNSHRPLKSAAKVGA